MHKRKCAFILRHYTSHAAMKVSPAAAGPAGAHPVRDWRFALSAVDGLALSASNRQAADVLPGQGDRGRSGLGAGLGLLVSGYLVLLAHRLFPRFIHLQPILLSLKTCGCR